MIFNNKNKLINLKKKFFKVKTSNYNKYMIKK